MAVKEVIVMPDERLRLVSQPVSFADPTLSQILQDLIDTLEANQGCVGIAAPQIGYSQRIVLIDATRSRKPIANNGRLLMINPRVVSQSGEVVAREGCLSLPDFTANVARAESIIIEFLESGGEVSTVSTAQFEARIILHEMDHLDGIVFLDRVKSLKTDVFRRKRY